MVPENFRLTCSMNCPAPWRKTSTKRVVNVFDRKCDQKWMLSSLMWLLRHKTWFLCLRDFFTVWKHCKFESTGCELRLKNGKIHSNVICYMFFETWKTPTTKTTIQLFLHTHTPWKNAKQTCPEPKKICGPRFQSYKTKEPCSFVEIACVWPFIGVNWWFSMRENQKPYRTRKKQNMPQPV